MDEVEIFHNQAMDLAEKAVLLKIRNNVDASIEIFKSAFSLEMQAALQLKEAYDTEPSRAILFRSAASLALNAGLFRDAEKMVAIGLSGNPPEQIADELRNIYENINFERHLQLKGVTILENDIQLSLAGKAVSYGMIKADEFIKRAEIFEHMTIRTAERLLKKPFREKGRISKEIKDSFETYYSIPRASSFAITLRVGYRPITYSLFDDYDNIQATVINEIVENIKMVNNHDEQKLKEKITNDDYFFNTLGLIKKLSPDNTEVSLVGLTTSKNGTEKHIEFTRTSDDIIIAPLIHETDVSDMEEFVVVGKLTYADANKSDIKLETTDGISYSIFVPKGILADIVKPYWEQYVTIRGRKQGTKIFFEDLELEK